MELYHLRTFITLAQEQNLTRAAQKLFTSPPSVSAHIKALEQELNVELFIRTPRGMHLTDAGETLKQKAEHALCAADDFLNSAQTICDQPSGCVRFGINIPPELLQISTLVANTHAQYPHVWQDLAALPWICDPYYCPFQVIAGKMFEERGLTCNKVMSISDDATRLELIKGGIGMSVIEKRLAKASDQIIIWETDPLFCDLNFAYLKARADEPLIAAITEKVTDLWQTESQLAIS